MIMLRLVVWISMMLLGWAETKFLKIRDFCMDFEPYFKVRNLVSVYPKSIILGQMTNLNMIFHVVVSVYRLVKIWNSPQFPDEFRNGQIIHSKNIGLSVWRNQSSHLHILPICITYIYLT